MKLLPPFKRNARSHGVALVITLSLIVLLTALVVGFTVTARFNRQLSAGYAKADQTELVALSAMSHAKALLASSIPDVGPNAPASPTNWWVAPGRLWTQTGNNTPTVINLYSGDSTAATDPNLNRRKIDGTYPIEPGGTAMRVAWIPLGKDPSLPVSATNPMVSRFAYWIDVENTRINLRTARKWTNTSSTRSELAPAATTYVPAVDRSTTFSPPGSTFGGVAPGSPTVVDISGLPGANNVNGLPDLNNSIQISNVREYRQFFASDADWDAFYQPNQFDLSIWGESPEFTPFGKSRLSSAQFRNKSLPGFQFYWDLDNPNQLLASKMALGANNYPPPNNTTDVNEYDYYIKAARSLSDAFQSTNWPGYSGTSMATKWATLAGLPATDSARLAEQVAWNLMTSHGYTLVGGDMSVELFGLGSKGRVGAGTDTEVISKKDLLSSPSGLTNRYFPQGGNPYVTQLGFELTQTGNKLGISLVGELYQGAFVNVFDDSVSVNAERGARIQTSDTDTGGVYIFPMTISFEMDTSSLPSPGGALPSGWTTTVVGTKTVFNFARTDVTNPLQAGALVAGKVKATPPSTNPTYLKANNYLGLKTPAPASPPGTSEPSLTITLASGATSATLSNVQIKVVALKSPGGVEYRIFQYCPLQDSSLAGQLLFPTPQNPTISLGDMTVATTTSPKTFTAEVSDPRRCSLSNSWTPSTRPIGTPNPAWSSLEIRAWTVNYFTTGSNPSSTGYPRQTPGDQYQIYSPGVFACLWTAAPYIVPATGDLYLNLTSASPGGIPDHLALELINSETGMALGSNLGTINPNTRIYPISWGIASRTRALEALFRRWKVGGTNINAATLASNIAANIPADGYKYRGELIPYLETGGGVLGGAATKWQKEALFRALAGRLTTQSSTFGVWGVAQTVQQTPGGAIVVTGEKRFYSVVRRQPYPGIDGVMGNAKSNGTGTFTETSVGGGGFNGPQFNLMRDTFDGPDAVPAPNPASVPVPYAASATVRGAYNPLKTYLTTETNYLEYLDP